MRKILEIGLLALLLWSPLPAASVDEWAVFVIELVVAALAVVYVLLDERPAVNPRLAPHLRRVRTIAAAFFAFLALQIVPLPAAVVRLLAPASYAFRELHAPEFGSMRWMSLSLVPSATLREGLFLATLFLLGFLVVRTAVRGRTIRRMIAVLVVSGVFQALYGLFELGRDEPRLLFYKKLVSPDSATGTFVNRSHFSGYLEMIVPLALGLAAARMNLLVPGARGWREKLVLWTSKGVLQTVLLVAAAVVMSVGVVLSNSRSGLVVLLFSFFLFIVLAVLVSSRAGPGQAWLRTLVRATVAVTAALALYIGVGATLRRFAAEDLLHEDRPLYWANTLDMVKDFPLFGTGLGTFSSVYGAYEKRGGPEMELVHAHNDYLEAVAELGAVGAGLLLGGILYLAITAFLAWKGRRNAEARALALGGLVSLAAMGLHALTDFNLHIPANMVLFVVVLALTPVMATYRKS